MNKLVSRIGGNVNVIGKVTIQIPFYGLNLVIYVEFLVLRESIPTMISMQGMILNGLDLYLQKRHVSHGTLGHNLVMENYFLIHLWTNDELTYTFYTEVELRKINSSFGHPSVSAFSKLLKRANNEYELEDKSR